MIQTNTYRIMIGCPSDIVDEVDIAKNIILEWSCLNAEARGIVLLPLHWSTNSYSSYGAHPQKILDKQLVDKSDMIVCIFGSKIGTPTDTSESGSIEELEEHVKAGKPAMVFFKQNVNIDSITPEELKRLQDFKNRIRGKVKWTEFSTAEGFKDVFRNELHLFLNDNWNKSTSPQVSAEPSVEDVFTPYEKELFCKWANNPVDQMYTQLRVKGGLEVHMGYHNGYLLESSQQIAEFEDLMDKFIKYRLIKLNKYDSRNNPIYTITKQGYDFAKTIKQE